MRTIEEIRTYVSELKDSFDVFGIAVEPEVLERLLDDIPDLLAEVERLRAERERTCEWHPVRDLWGESHYEGTCGSAWVMEDGGTPLENDCHYCAMCGGKVVVLGGDEECGEDEDE